MQLRFDGDDNLQSESDREKQCLPDFKFVLKNQEESRDHSGNKLCTDLYSSWLPSK
jgi:hypothetical protein